MPKDSPQDLGRQFEKKIAEELNGSLQPGSGNQWDKPMDVSCPRFLLSLKSTLKKSIPIKEEDWDELVEAVEAPGGVGADTIPAMFLKLADKYELVVVRKEDFISLANHKPLILLDKSELKRQRSKVPELLRDET